MMRRSVFTVVLALTLAASAVTVFAHMKAAKTEPAADATLTAPPTKVQVWFTQAPDPKVSKLALTGPGGPVTLKDFKVVAADKSIVAIVDGAPGQGRFTASWQAAGNDGHIQKGQFSFSVKATP
jgi:methionine-rich copper-binding protein CopC